MYILFKQICMQGSTQQAYS